jgi:hypothetical protein
MKEPGKWVGGALVGLTVCLSARAVAPGSSTNQYDRISARNVFGLKDPPPVVVPPLPEQPRPKIILTGITTMLSNKLAFIRVQFPAKPGEPAKEQSMMLAEGQREAGIEVLQIDEKAGRIQVNNLGMEMPVTFDKDALKTATTANLNTNPAGAPPNPFAAIPPTGATPSSPSNPLQRPLPFRNLHLAAPAVPPLPGSAPRAAAIAQPAPTAAAQPAAAPSVQEKPLTAEEQQILNELERSANGAAAAQPAPTLPPGPTQGRARFLPQLAPQPIPQSQLAPQ